LGKEKKEPALRKRVTKRLVWKEGKRRGGKSPTLTEKKRKKPRERKRKKHINRGSAPIPAYKKRKGKKKERRRANPCLREKGGRKKREKGNGGPDVRLQYLAKKNPVFYQREKKIRGRIFQKKMDHPHQPRH